MEYLYVATIQYVIGNNCKEWVGFCDDPLTAFNLCEEHRVTVHSTDKPLKWEHISEWLDIATSYGECQYQVSKVVLNTLRFSHT